ncbi:MAG: glycine dehydrogenase (aminomethyl-transferring) [Crocinitomicaceae bacterium]|nr:glycine dehydrogenase (aminomethyl-transferring) [Crocinitomicaceae bacterium]
MHSAKFTSRHIGPRAEDQLTMLRTIGSASIEDLIAKTVPAKIRQRERMKLTSALSESQYLEHIDGIASKNVVFKNYIGMGYYPTEVPSVIRRNVLENPGWYTAYTPYQAEIAQGRLEALLNFQTMVCDLTGMELANASLLDEATAVAEAMAMAFAARPRAVAKTGANRFLVDEATYPQTVALLKTRAKYLGVEVEVVPRTGMLHEAIPDVFGVLFQYPDGEGVVSDLTAVIAQAKSYGAQVVVAADLMALALLKNPGTMGADVVVGTTQRFGVPMGYGGPHAAFFAAQASYKRHFPGRIIGISKDRLGAPALRMALQTREQHIRRDKATSNICTAQSLLAVMASMYAVYHGPEGLREIAEGIHCAARGLDAALRASVNFDQVNDCYFDTLKVRVNGGENEMKALRARAEAMQINLRYFEDGMHVGVALNERVSDNELIDLCTMFGVSPVSGVSADRTFLGDLWRDVDYLHHPVFNRYRSETEMMRYIKHLENRDLSLVHSMIPLGSCTMKLNAATELIPITWAAFAELHPFCPPEQAAGTHEMLKELERDLAVITGFAGLSLQPNSGAQGEFAGLMVIRAYHEARGEQHRDVCLIPSSAHGTNPASAVMAGMKVVVVGCDDEGNIDMQDLRKLAEAHSSELGALMITYPSTHGVFEEAVLDITQLIHGHGGQVYMDGANMNAQVGLTSPGLIGADVCHLNLHKTFAIPHGGGGPGVGPIGVAEHLVPFLPGHPVIPTGGEQQIDAISGAPFGSALICQIPYAYIKMLGEEGLRRSTEVAILNANYLKARLENDYSILYTGEQGTVAHEMILDCRSFKASAGVEVMDIAKRLIDYGFHAPTVSWPVAGTLMVEPTESESLEELDRFVHAMAAIREEIRAIENGDVEREDNVVKMAPHTAREVASSSWEHPYSREAAAYPSPEMEVRKFWTPVARVDNAYGDRNLICSCPPLSSFEELLG